MLTFLGSVSTRIPPVWTFLASLLISASLSRVACPQGVPDLITAPQRGCGLWEEPWTLCQESGSGVLFCH